MKLNPIGSNQNEVEVNGMRVLFSYSTPVAARIEDKVFRTDKKWSVTTSKHINQWLDGQTAEVRPQSFFDALCN